MPQFSHSGIEINYEIWGELSPNAKVVTLVNGYTRGMSDFRAMTSYLNKRGIVCISMDNRAAGMTQATGDFDLRDMAMDVAALLTYLSVNRTALLGISMGGLIVQLIPRLVPAIADRLILISTSSSPQLEQLQSDQWIPDVSSIEERLARNFSEPFLEKNRILLKAMAKNVLKEIENSGFAQRAEQQRRAIRKTPPELFIDKLGVPTLIIHGDQDRIIGVDAVARLKTKFSNSEVKIFAGAGHLLIAEKPSELYEVIANYLNAGNIGD
jgi:pimeloyl-ACP methyl ester carboxylesterase